MKSVGSYLSMECQILASYHEFGRKLTEVIPENPKQLSQVTPSYGSERFHSANVGSLILLLGIREHKNGR